MTNKITYHWPIDAQFDLGAIGGWFGGGGSGTNDHMALTNLAGGPYKTGGHTFLAQRLSYLSNPNSDNDSVDTRGFGTRIYLGCLWVNPGTDQVWMCVDNTPTAAIWKKVTDQVGGTEYQTTLIDDTTTNIIIADVTVARMAWIEYVLQTSTSYQTGMYRVVHDGAGGVDADHEYNFIPPEVDEVVFSADVLGNDLRVNVQCISIGEDPKFRYTIRSILLPI